MMIVVSCFLIVVGLVLLGYLTIVSLVLLGYLTIVSFVSPLPDVLSVLAA